MRETLVLSGLVAATVAIAACRETSATPGRGDTTAPKSAPLVIRVLDVGQGDATLIENGGSRVLIDGGPDLKRFEALLDSLRLNNSTIDVVVLSHLHADHLIGLRALFESKRH